MNQTSFKLEYESKDALGGKFKIWSGPSVKGEYYRNLGVDPDMDRVFYIQILGNDDFTEWPIYRFKYEDQIKLLELVIKNKQLPNAKVRYILLMVKKLFSWLPENYTEFKG